MELKFGDSVVIVQDGFYKNTMGTVVGFTDGMYEVSFNKIITVTTKWFKREDLQRLGRD